VPVLEEAVEEVEEALGGEEGVAVLFEALLAFAWNWAKVLVAVGFTANTIPAWQWLAGFVCAQKNQRGADAD